MTKIAVIVGSISPTSINKKLAEALVSLAPEDVDFDILSVDLPLFNVALERDMPQPVVDFKERIEGADGVLFVTPEYDRSIPGALKNAMEWGSRPPGQNSFSGKPVGIVGASAGPLGTAQAQFQLRSIISFMDVKYKAQPEVYLNYPAAMEDDGTVKPGSVDFLRSYIEGFVNFVKEES